MEFFFRLYHNCIPGTFAKTLRTAYFSENHCATALLNEYNIYGALQITVLTEAAVHNCSME